MEIAYNSEVLDKVSNLEIWFYKESSIHVYKLLSDEINYGKLLQKEQ